MCAALGAVALFSVPAFAGHYEQTNAYNGTTTTFDPDHPRSYDWQTYGLWPRYPLMGACDGAPGSCHLQGTVTVTFTWVPDPLLTSDPPPNEVYVHENAEVWWDSEGDAQGVAMVSGSRSVSTGGIATETELNQSGFKSSDLSKSCIRKAGGGASFSVSATFDASCSGGGPPPTNPQDDDIHPVSLNVRALYNVSIHAHPYNFRKYPQRPGDTRKNPDTRTPGTLIYRYTWDSTSGNKADLSNIQIDETVDYSGNAVGDYFTIPILGEFYSAPDPPFRESGVGDWVYRNPTRGRTRLPIPHTDNGADDYIMDFHRPGGWFTFPHDPLRWTFDAKQVYEYHCPDCMAEDEWRPIEDGPEAKVHTISRSFFCLDDSNTTDPLCWWTSAHWRYEVTKDGDTAWMEMSRFSLIPIGWGPW